MLYNINIFILYLYAYIDMQVDGEEEEPAEDSSLLWRVEKAEFCGFLRCQQSETTNEKSQGKNKNKNKDKGRETEKERKGGRGRKRNEKKIINTYRRKKTKTFYAASKHVILIIFVVAELLFLKIIEF